MSSSCFQKFRWFLGLDGSSGFSGWEIVFTLCSASSLLAEGAGICCFSWLEQYKARDILHGVEGRGRDKTT